MTGSDMSRVLKKTESVIHKVTTTARGVSSVMLGFMIVLIAADVVGRYVFNHSIRGTVDVIEETLIFIVFFGTAELVVLNRHIKVDLVVSALSEKVQAVLFCIATFGSLVISIIIMWQVTLRGWSLLLRPTLVTLNLEWPVGPFYMVVAFGLLLLCLELTVAFINSLIGLFRENPQGDAGSTTST